MTSPSVLTEKMPKGSLAFCNSDGRTVVNRSRDLLADLILGASLLAVVVIVYSFHMAPDLIPRFEHHHRASRRGQSSRGLETREPCPNHDDI